VAATSTIQLVRTQASQIWSGLLLGTLLPADGATMADPLIRCHEKDLVLPLKLAADLTVQRLMVSPDRPEEIGSRLMELRITAFEYVGHPLGSALPPNYLAQN
jgi:hypothetical protein